MAEIHPIPTDPRFKNLTGKRFGRWSVIGYAGKSWGKTVWRCRCECGGEKIVNGGTLSRGLSKSCGCLRREVQADAHTTHGLSSTKSYRTWTGMIKRCENPREPGYSDYGGRGISVCEGWHEFAKFFADMGHPPKGTSIDRIDVNGHYCPQNCRWATATQQARNKRNSRLLTIDNETKCLMEWAEVSGINQKLITDRLNRGWDERKAIFHPADERFRTKLNRTRRRTTSS